MRPAEGDVDESNSSFAAIPFVDIPRHTLLVLRSIRVVLQEAIANYGISSFNGYAAVADLVLMMAASFQSDMIVDGVTELVNRFGDQFWDIRYVSGSLAIKDKSPLTVPSAFTYQKKPRLIAENATPSSARAAQPQHRPD